MFGDRHDATDCGKRGMEESRPNILNCKQKVEIQIQTFSAYQVNNTLRQCYSCLNYKNKYRLRDKIQDSFDKQHKFFTKLADGHMEKTRLFLFELNSKNEQRLTHKNQQRIKTSF